MMKYKITLFILLFGFTSFASAQTKTVEKSVDGIQTGALGVWIHHEGRLSDSFALRGEVGFDAALFGGSFYDHTGVVFTPVITAEPRWYYNIAKRARQGKSTLNNSANFLTVKVSYHPDWFTISNYDNNRVAEQISIIPEWAIRRNLGAHFNYELGIGIGYRYYFYKHYGPRDNEGDLAGDIRLRIGYSF